MNSQDLLKELLPLVSYYGLWFVFFGMMIEGSIMIILSGIFCYMGVLEVDKAILAAASGAIIGDQSWYFAGRFFGEWLFGRFPKLKHRVSSLESGIRDKGQWLAFGSRFVYSGAIAFPLTLGAYRFSYKKFTVFDALGVTVWANIGIFIGYILGTSAEKLFGKISKIEHLLLLIIMVVIAIYIVKGYAKLNDFIKKGKSQ